MHVLVAAVVELQVKPLKDGQVESSVWAMIVRAQGNWGSQMREDRLMLRGLSFLPGGC